MPFFHKLFLFIFCNLILLPCFSQDTINRSSYIVIDNILITGNKKTKESIITRELNFKEGDTIYTHEQEEIFKWSKNRIFNTTLFITVNLLPIDRGAHHVDILITVKERWYIYPVPIFELADRNFNEWWQERHRDPERVNIGIYYIQKNVRGRNETLRMKFQLGFTKKYELFYFIPYLNKKQRSGLNFEASFIRNKQTYYKTSENKLLYFDGNKIIKERFRTAATYTYRKKFYETHSFGGGFFYNWIADTVRNLNPDYLLNGRTSQRYFPLRYTFIHDKRDVAYYPLKGKYVKADVEKLGLGIFKDLNQLNITGEAALFRPLNKKFFFATGIKQKISFPHKQPYLQTRALGYDKDYVSGYELYVIDGEHFSLAKVNLKWKLFSTIKDVQSVPVDEFSTIPFALYLKVYSDAGYVWKQYNVSNNARLTNQFLLGGGVGLDIVSYYDFVMRLEYSINRLGQNGFFIHFRSAI